MGKHAIFICIDSESMALERKRDLDIPRYEAAQLGRSALELCNNGFYTTADGRTVTLSPMVQNAIRAKVSIPPDAPLPDRQPVTFAETEIQVTNESTLGAAYRLARMGSTPLALNFANGIHPGGGFLSGSRAQEEALCRSSALYLTLEGDPMYEAHAQRPLPDSTDWAILSPRVPVFRDDRGRTLEAPWLLDFITCAAPFAPTVGQEKSRALLKKRINRILAIAYAYGYIDLVLGAWGCGAFKNDPYSTAIDFKDALEHAFEQKFRTVIFAITDWSEKRQFLGPFREVFAKMGEN